MPKVKTIQKKEEGVKKKKKRQISGRRTKRKGKKKRKANEIESRRDQRRSVGELFKGRVVIPS